MGWSTGQIDVSWLVLFHQQYFKEQVTLDRAQDRL